MSCKFLGSTCTDTIPCCDGFNCNNAGICDFYTFNSTQSCPKGYSQVYTSDGAGICALDLKTTGSWVITLLIIIFIIIIVALVCFTAYKIYKHHKK